MAKYGLGYYKDGQIHRVELEKLECLFKYSKNDLYDLKFIDKFTANFENQEDLLKFLWINGLITKDIKKIIITKGQKNPKMIYDGDILIFEEDFDRLSDNYIHKWFLEYEKDILTNIDKLVVIEKICARYLKKYRNAINSRTGNHFWNLSTFEKIYDVVLRIKKILQTGPLGKEAELLKLVDYYIKYIPDLIAVEFYKIDERESSIQGEIVLEKEKNRSILQYKNLHDFIVFLKKLDKNLQFDEEHLNEIDVYDNSFGETNDDLEVSYQPVYEKPEEFLTEDDFERVRKFQSPIFETFKDGNDFVVPTPPMNDEDIKKLILTGDGYMKR